MLLPLLLATDFVGAAVCAECHAEIAARHTESRHARALRPVNATDLAAKLSEHPLRERSGAEFLYQPEADGLRASVQLGGQRADMLLEWAFGAGAQGVTPVGRYAGKWVEHRISYYSTPGRPSRTVGHPGASSVDAVSALGMAQDGATITRCFGCHATRVKPGPDLAAMEPGVRCERCHGPGRGHVEAARAGTAKQALLNAGRLPPKASVEVCAECHRLTQPGTSASAMPEVDDPVSIRFQPVGLMASKCFQKSGRLSCLTCHDPHTNAAARHSGHYTQRCAGCHTTAHRKGEDCVGCHMPRSSPLPYLSFTDHRIR